MFKKIIRKIKKAIKKLLVSLLPLKNIIVFESVPDLSDNTKAVFDEMVRRGLNNKYKMVWEVKGEPESFPKIHNVRYYNLKDESDRREYKRDLLCAKCLVCCNDFLVPIKPSQQSFYLSHGTTFKSVRSYYTVPKKIKNVLVAADGVADMQASEINVDKERIFALGFPRNDVLTAPNKNLHDYFDGEFEKVVVWYPTFRQHKSGVSTASDKALPIIHNTDFAERLNAAAKKCGVLLVLKPHFAQDVSYVKDMGFENIRFIDDSFFETKKISSYEFVGSCDAMITDYSSIYYDYTLCDRPVAAVWEDIEDYKNNPGLIDNYEYYMSGAEKVYNIDELIGFIERVGQGIDLLADKRREIRDIVNYSTDGKNSQRVVDYIIKNAKL